MTRPTALVIDDEPDICQLLQITLSKMNIDTTSAATLQEAKDLIKTQTFDITLTDMRLPDGDGLDLVAFVQTYTPNMPIAVITAHGNMEIAIKALKMGAFDFISKPIDLNNLREIISGALKINTASFHIPSDTLIGDSTVMINLRHDMTKVARSQAPVYISGPSGCGKELVAKIIHLNGPRRDEPFIPVNCGAIPQELMESEFFGFKKGSFTGATHDKIGFFQAAHKGTLFLDEVADLPLNMQVKLLRAIQEKAIRPIGSTQEISVDVRILCATHKNLQLLVQQNLFRQDLFYRLNVIQLKVPSLKEHLSDVPQLTQHILAKIATAHGKPLPRIDQEMMDALLDYHYPGNIRELENILERAFALCEGREFKLADLQISSENSKNQTNEQLFESSDLPLDDYLLNIERQAIIDALGKSNGNKTQAAKLLGISFRTLRYRLKKVGLDNEENETKGI